MEAQESGTLKKEIEYEGWMLGCLKKRTPDAIRILMDLIQAGLRNGQTSANDIRDVKFVQPNIIGCTVRLLPKFGFVHTDERTKTTAARKHKRRVDIYKLSERWKAEAYVRHLQSSLINKKEIQEELGI